MQWRQTSLFLLTILFVAEVTSNSCSQLPRPQIYSRHDISHDLYPFANFVWYNTTFWDGYESIAWEKDYGSHCKNRFTENHFFLVLTDQHQRISLLNDSVTVLNACIMSQAGDCERNTTVNAIYCNGDLLYQFSGSEIWSEYFTKVYICFDRTYYSSCQTPGLSLPAENLNNSVSLMKVDLTSIKHGWLDSVLSGINYTIPLLKDIRSVSDVCYGTDGYGLYSLEGQYLSTGDEAVGMRVCYLTENAYILEKYTLQYSCNQVIFTRSCTGKLQLELSLYLTSQNIICLIRAEDIKVIPEIRHNVTQISQGRNQYNPYLQFRCSFKMSKSNTYVVKWYLNGKIVKENGPSNTESELVITEKDLGVKNLNYKVRCAFSKSSRKRSDPVEISSDEYYAGFKVMDNVSVSKSGNKVISVEQTVPIGCAYSDLSAECEDTVTLVDENLQHDVCSDGIFATNADSINTPHHKIQTLKQNEEWEGPSTYNFVAKTVDKTYDDSNSYEMSMKQASSTKKSIDVGHVKVSVTDIEYSKDKMCYSHADPHMRTGDGNEYEQQSEGDYMLYRNRYGNREQVQVLERARYCYNRRGPVCTCAVIVRAGADAFMINRCSGRPFEIEFIQCGDFGILDVVKISDDKYEVYTPLGTKVSIRLLDGWGNGRNMNIDIYLSPKDSDVTDGLCGVYDNDSLNDFRLRNHQTEPNNDDYKFSNSWRLKEKENLFENHRLQINKWQGYLPPICHREGSITMDKCSKANKNRRSRRESERNAIKLKRNLYHNKDNIDIRNKREANTNISYEEALEICKSAIARAPAVIEVPDKLANEDPNDVAKQCAYDVHHGGDVSWVDAHIAAVNDIAISILALNPVYVGNHSSTVETFLSHTCVHNCSGNGVCLKNGLCNCTSMYRGHDCSYDIRIPPLVLDVRDGGICDDDNGCQCLEVKSDNLFKGFKCDIKTLKVKFKGTSNVIGNSLETGFYEDLYTGHCCTSQVRRKRSESIDDKQPYIYGYNLAISNDGLHFGNISSVYFYDGTCLYIEDTSQTVVVNIKDDFCYVNDTCIKKGFTQKHPQHDSYCNVCEPEQSQFSLSFEICNQVDDKGSKVIWIIVGCITGTTVLVLAVVFILCKFSNRSRVDTGNDFLACDLPDIQQVDAQKAHFNKQNIATERPNSHNDMSRIGEEMNNHIQLNVSEVSLNVIH